MRILASISVRLGLVGAAMAFLAGCAPVRYVGDGTLTRTKAPAFFCQDQFDVDLGAVDFTHPATMQFRLEGLPKREYTVGFDVGSRDSSGAASNAAVRDAHVPDPLVELVLRNEKGEVVLNQRGHLSDWVWSSALSNSQWSYVYNRGEGHEIRINPTTTEGQRTGIKADDGWGTYFTPRRRGRYQLGLAVVEADPRASSYAMSLHVRGVVGCL